jgi:DNA-binding transcriptional LysR family regulator
LKTSLIARCSSATGGVVVNRHRAGRFRTRPGDPGEFRQLEAELSDINHLNKGVLRLGIPPMVGMLMAGPISLFRQRYPGVELKVSEFGGLTVQQAVMNGDLDVAMTALPVEEESGLATYRFSVIRSACWSPAPVSGQRANPFPRGAGGTSAADLQRRFRVEPPIA